MVLFIVCMVHYFLHLFAHIPTNNSHFKFSLFISLRMCSDQSRNSFICRPRNLLFSTTFISSFEKNRLNDLNALDNFVRNIMMLVFSLFRISLFSVNQLFAFFNKISPLLTTFPSLLPLLLS